MGGQKFWYVAHTKPLSEIIARDNLISQNFECYLPLVKTFNKRSKSIIYAPLFKRYIFLRPNDSNISLSTVRSTIGVSSLVKFGSLIAKCNDSTVFEIKDYEKSHNLLSSSEIISIKKGDVVSINHGPFSGYLAKVSSFNDNNVNLLFDILGKDTVMSLSLGMVSKVEVY